jgi:hypothetical protein
VYTHKVSQQDMRKVSQQDYDIVQKASLPWQDNSMLVEKPELGPRQ